MKIPSDAPCDPRSRDAAIHLARRSVAAGLSMRPGMMTLGRERVDR